MTDRSGGAEPVLGLARVERGLHRVADLVGGEQQVLLDLVVGQADVVQAVVAHVRGRMAAQAIVREDAGAVLKRRLVGHLAARERIPRIAALVRRRRRERQHEAEDDEQAEQDFFHRMSSAAAISGTRT
jgi:hypothetical protein